MTIPGFFHFALGCQAVAQETEDVGVLIHFGSFIGQGLSSVLVLDLYLLFFLPHWRGCQSWACFRDAPEELCLDCPTLEVADLVQA